MPTPVMPSLPLELERDIFELAATLHPETSVNLVRVAHRVQIWIEPLIYRAVILDDPNKTARLFVRTIDSRPAPFFARHVKTLCMTSSINASQASRVLSVCTGVVDLIFWAASPPKCLLPTIQAYPLQKLSVKIETLFELYDKSTYSLVDKLPDFSHHIFANLTHLDIVNPPGSLPSEFWYGLARLPKLTHLALGDLFYFAHEDILRLLPELLTRCQSLITLIIICGAEELRGKISNDIDDKRLVIIPTFHYPKEYPLYLRGLKCGDEGMWLHAESAKVRPSFYD